jgi:hypothetical protein
MIRRLPKLLTFHFIKMLVYSNINMKTVNPSQVLGKLSIIPTPIGNMNDLSPNMLKALFTADLIGC